MNPQITQMGADENKQNTNLRESAKSADNIRVKALCHYDFVLLSGTVKFNSTFSCLILFPAGD